MEILLKMSSMDIACCAMVFSNVKSLIQTEYFKVNHRKRFSKIPDLRLKYILRSGFSECNRYTITESGHCITCLIDPYRLLTMSKCRCKDHKIIHGHYSYKMWKTVDLSLQGAFDLIRSSWNVFCMDFQMLQNLHPYVVEEVLLYLPAVDIAACCLAIPAWTEVITSKRFLKRHKRRFTSINGNLILNWCLKNRVRECSRSTIVRSNHCVVCLLNPYRLMKKSDCFCIDHMRLHYERDTILWGRPLYGCEPKPWPECIHD
uniref:RH1 n=1 Tax=Zoothera dauma adenovirus TaxID=3073259 RepID=A0AA51RK65_9ADEN|nr:RH1 [Zoothera dauma adenovirus]